MVKDISFEFKRKVWHLFSLLYIPIYFILDKSFGYSIALLSLTAILIFFLIVEFIRLRYNFKIPLLHSLLREKDKEQVASSIYIAIAAILVFAVFDFWIASVSLMMMTLGDSAAALIGMRFGKRWIPGLKNVAWEGIIAEFVVDLIIGLIFLNWIVALVMALVATFVETIFTHADDNLMIPLFSGFSGQIVTIILKLV